MRTLFKNSYTRITYLSDKDPSSVKFLMRQDFNCQIVDKETTQLHSPIREHCVDMRRYLSSANKTLSFLAGIVGVKYTNIVQVCQTLLDF